MTVRVEHADQDERLLREEGLMLRRQGIADETLPHRRDRIAKPGALLNGPFAGMKGRHDRAQSKGVAGMPTKCGKASIRASHARTCG